jgi:hypothetical protein
MHIRRPIAALFTALALFGGGATMTGCQAAGDGQRDGTTDSGNPDNGDEDEGNLPDNSNPETDSEDSDDDRQDPD